MAIFKSDRYELKSTAVEVSNFLSRPANLQEILPHDRIEDWKSTDDGCSFKIKGLASIELRLESSSDDVVLYTSASGKPFPFKLSIHLLTSDKATTMEAAFDADVNSFMASMLKTPLVNFLNSIGNALKLRYT